jgi:hypothetical protein
LLAAADRGRCWMVLEKETGMLIEAHPYKERIRKKTKSI